MQSLQEVFKTIEELKKQKKEIAKMVRSELEQHGRHCELCEELKTLKMEKKAIEDQIIAKSQGHAEKLAEIQSEMAAYQEMMSDIALNLYMKSEPVEVIDEYEVKFVPVFSVKFKKE